jgi:TldD protein
VTATRPKLGTEARTNGPFASSYHARVLPEFMDVVDDPGLKSYDGKGWWAPTTWTTRACRRRR